MSEIDWSKAPEDATHAGIISTGGVCWYKDVTSDGYRYCAGLGDRWGRNPGQPVYRPLIPRPRPDHKEEEGVEWAEEGLFPPGGDRCEAYIMADAINQHGPAGKWVAGLSRGKAIASNGGWGGIFEDDGGVMHFVGAQMYFRPIQSHRDKVIEAAFQVIYDKDDYRDAAEALYEQGLLKLPGDEQWVMTGDR